jgi:hypothetical protein
VGSGNLILANGRGLMFIAKEIGKTEKGSTYVIGQDTPSSFHISVTYAGNTIYEHFENPPNIEFLKEMVINLDNELHNNQYEPEIK